MLINNMLNNTHKYTINRLVQQSFQKKFTLSPGSPTEPGSPEGPEGPGRPCGKVIKRTAWSEETLWFDVPDSKFFFILPNDFHIDVLTVGPSGPGGPSISMPCEDEKNKRVMVRVMVETSSTSLLQNIMKILTHS